MDIAKHSLEMGAEYPYDAPDAWWIENSPLPEVDWAHAAARGVIADLGDRRGIKRSFEDVDEDVRAEIVEALAEIIRLAAELRRKQ